MTGDQEQPEVVEELVQTTEHGTNVIRGEVAGTVVQIDYVKGDLVFGRSEPAGD